MSYFWPDVYSDDNDRSWAKKRKALEVNKDYDELIAVLGGKEKIKKTPETDEEFQTINTIYLIYYFQLVENFWIYLN